MSVQLQKATQETTRWLPQRAGLPGLNGGGVLPRYSPAL